MYSNNRGLGGVIMEFINNLRIGNRLLVFFATLLIIVVAGLFFITWSTKAISEQVDSLYKVHLLSMEFLIEADRDGYQSSLALSHLLAKDTLAGFDGRSDLINEINENYQQVLQRYSKFEQLSEITRLGSNTNLNTEFHTNYQHLGKHTSEIIQRIQNKDYAEAYKQYFGIYQESFGDMRSAMDQYTDISLANAEDAYQRSLEIGRRIQVESLLVIVLIIGIIVVSILLLTNSINKPLNAAVSYLSSVSAGDLTLDVPEKFLKRRDEVGQMMRNLQEMALRLADIVSVAQDNARNIAQAAEALQKTSVQLSQGANEQAASIEEVSSTMEEISANISQNSDHARETGQISKLAQTGMEDVASFADEAFKAQKEISSKIQIINDIAFQTNILALNAAVEAARAGEHGKGFAVVAQEVRKLAERCKLAADDIIVMASQGLATAEKAGKAMSNTIPHIKKTTNLVTEIAASSVEQNHGVGQINDSAQQLNTIAQQNASASEEIATNSEELSAHAQNLNETISFFRTKNHS